MRKAKKRGESPAGRSSSRIPSGVSAVTTVSSAFPGTARFSPISLSLVAHWGRLKPVSLTVRHKFRHPSAPSFRSADGERVRSLSSMVQTKGLTCARCGMRYGGCWGCRWRQRCSRDATTTRNAFGGNPSPGMNGTPGNTLALTSAGRLVSFDRASPMMATAFNVTGLQSGEDTDGHRHSSGRPERRRHLRPQQHGPPLHAQQDSRARRL